MPLQRFNANPVAREPGLVQSPVDLGGVTELRLHGVGGTTPENLLGDLAPDPVSGDRIAGFYRTADLPEHGGDEHRVPRRHVEAYSWGGLTSRSGWRVLWVLLLPFAMANVAGWMCAKAIHQFRPFFLVHRWFVRWAALAVTVNFLLIAAITGMDLIAYQCGGNTTCATAMWWPLNRLGQGYAYTHPGLRIVLGALLPVAVIVLLATLTLRSIGRYEDVVPPYKGRTQPPRSTRSAAQSKLGLHKREFWDGQRSTVDLGCVHVATALALVGMLIGYTARTTMTTADVALVRPELWTWTVRLGVLTVGLALIVLMVDVSRFVAPALPVVATAVVGLASWFAIQQSAVAGPPAEALPGMHDAADLTLRVVLALVGVTLVPSLPSLLRLWGLNRVILLGPFVALAASVAIINIVMAGAIVRIGELLFQPAATNLTSPKGADAPAAAKLTVYYPLGDSTPYLTLIPVAVVAVFVIIVIVAYWLVGRSAKHRKGVRDEYDPVIVKPAGEDMWYYSPANPDYQKDWKPWRKSMNWMFGQEWAARVARARLVARLPRQLDRVLATMVLLTLVLLVVKWQRPDWLETHPLPSWLQTTGSWLVAAVPFALIILLRSGWRSLESRKHIGTIWDVITFWPRAYHPLAPPCYAERAVPELQRRLLRIHGPRTDGTSGRVVLATHSQGTVIAVAALLQRGGRPPLPPEGRAADPSVGNAADDVALVTFGSPLGTLYRWGFPAYFNNDVLKRLVDEDSDVKVAAWVNCYYDTDYIGREVLSPKGNAVDKQLPDPITCWFIYGQSEPRPGRHSGYWSDPKVWAEVDRLGWLPGGGPPPMPVVGAQPGPVLAPRHLRTEDDLRPEPQPNAT